MQRQQQADPLRAAESVDEQVRRLRHPVGGRRTGQLDPTAAGVHRQQGLSGVALPHQPAGPVGQTAHGSCAAVLTSGAGEGAAERGGAPLTVTGWAPE